MSRDTFEREVEREEWLRQAARGSINFSDIEDQLLRDVIACNILGLTWEELQRQPAEWVDWSLTFKSIQVEEAPKPPTGPD